MPKYSAWARYRNCLDEYQAPDAPREIAPTAATFGAYIRAGWDNIPHREARASGPVTDALHAAWEDAHLRLNRASSKHDDTDGWHEALTWAIAQLWRLHTAGRMHGHSEMEMTIASQILVDDIREACLRREIAVAHHRLFGRRDESTETLANAMLGLGLSEPHGAEKGEIEWALTLIESSVVADTGEPSARVAREAERHLRDTIARVEHAWRSIWPIGVGVIRPAPAACKRTDPLGPLRPAALDPIGGVGDGGARIAARGVFAATGGAVDGDPSHALASKLRMTALGIEHLQVAHRAWRVKLGALITEPYLPSGAESVIALLAATEEQRLKEEERAAKHSRSLGTWMSNITRAKNNPNWKATQRVDIPTGSRAEILAILVHEYIQADIPLGAVYEAIDQWAAGGTITADGRRDLRAFATIRSIQYLGVPAIDSDPLGDPQGAHDEGTSTLRKHIRKTLARVEEGLLHIPVTAEGPNLDVAMNASMTSEVDRALDRASGAYPIATPEERESLGRPSVETKEGEWSYAERILLRRYSLNETWALYAHEIVHGEDSLLPLPRRRATILYAAKGRRLATTASGTGESLGEITERILTASHAIVQGESKSAYRPANATKTSLAPLRGHRG